jgi:diacylglycerol kinase family enzyme
MHWIVIYNKKSGRAKWRSRDEMIADFFVKHHVSFDMVPLHHYGFDLDKSFCIERIQSVKDPHILVVGGDGTLRRTVEYLYHKDIQVPIAYLPSGSANIFAKIHGISSTPSKTLGSILQKKYTPVDISLINGKYVFLLAAVFGNLGAMAVQAEHNYKETIGPLAYLLSLDGVIKNFKKKDISLQIDTNLAEQYKAHSIIVGTDQLVQAFMDHKTSAPTLHTVIAQNDSFAGLVRGCVEFYSGKNSDVVQHRRGDFVQFEAKFGDEVHFDGDPMELTDSTFTIERKPDYLSFVM